MPAELSRASNGGVLWFIRAGLLVALGIALFLAVSSLRGDGVPGCGPESDCDRVLSSRWAYLGGFPVSLFAVPVYLALLGLSWQSKPNTKVICALSVLVIAEALWFVGLQFFVLRAYCKFCMTAHVAGLMAAVAWLRTLPISTGVAFRWGLGGVAAAAAAAFAQAITPQRSAVLVATPTNVAPAAVAATSTNLATASAAPAAPSAPVPTNTPSTAAPAAPAPVEEFAIVGGQFKLKLSEVPVLGSRSAPKKVVKIFDYTCHHCRDLHHHFEAVMKTYPNAFALISLPMPLDASCNMLMRRTPAPHVNACEYAKLGLAVFFSAPEKVHEYDQFIYNPERPPALEAARQYAAKLVGKDINAALADPRVMAQLNQNIQIYAANSRVGGKSSMPQIIFADGTSIGQVPSVEALESILRQATLIGGPI